MLIPIAGISTDIYLPSLPAITHHFSVDKALAQYTVAVFIIAMGISQFFAGPISDSKGRKPIILLALMTQLLATIGILFSYSIHAMIVFRFIQGLGSAFMIVPARAIINDTFEGDALKKQLYYMTMSFALGPMLGPFIGGYLQHYFGWQANFLFILGFIVIMILLVSFTITETIREKSTFSFHHFWKNPAIIMQNRFFTSCTLISGTVYAYTMIFNIAGPFVIQTVLGQSAIVYGHVALLNGIAWFSGNVLNRLTINMSTDFKAKVMLWLSVAISATFLVMSCLGYFSLPVFAIPVILLLFCSSMVFSIHVTQALHLFPKMAASANAFLFSSCWIISGLFSLLATQLKVHSLVPIAVTYFAVGVLNMFIYYRFIRALQKL